MHTDANREEEKETDEMITLTVMSSSAPEDAVGDKVDPMIFSCLP